MQKCLDGRMFLRLKYFFVFKVDWVNNLNFPSRALDIDIVRTSGPIYTHVLTLILAWMSNYIPGEVWGEITYPFPSLGMDK